MAAVREANEQLLEREENQPIEKVNHTTQDANSSKGEQEQIPQIKHSYHSVVSQKHYVQYSQRWLILVFFLLSGLINGIQYKICVPISTDLHKIYGVSDFVITSAASIYMVMHPLLTFWASDVIVNKGWGYATKLGVILTILGCVIRLLVNQLRYLSIKLILLLGQLLCGIGRPLILNGQSSMAQNWFYPKARKFILTLQSIMVSFSMVFGLLIPGSIVFKNYNFDPENEQESIDQGKKLTFYLMLIEFILTLVILPALFIIKNSAPTPPSALANSDQPIAIKQAVKSLFSNMNFLFAFIPYSIYFGFLKAFGYILMVSIPTMWLQLVLYNKSHEFSLGSFSIVGGFISQIIVLIFFSQFRSYKPISIVLVLLTVACLSTFYFVIALEKPVLLYSITFFLGFFLYPLVPLMLELSCEIVYPLSGSFAVGVMYSGATILSVVNSQVFTVILHGSNSTKGDVILGLVIIAVAMLIGLVVFLFVKEKFNRTAEIKARLNNSSVYFNKSSIHKSFSSQFNVIFRNFIELQALRTPKFGEYPTYYPGGDRLQYVESSEDIDIKDDEVLEQDQQEKNLSPQDDQSEHQKQ